VRRGVRQNEQLGHQRKFNWSARERPHGRSAHQHPATANAQAHTRRPDGRTREGGEARSMTREALEPARRCQAEAAHEASREWRDTHLHHGQQQEGAREGRARGRAVRAWKDDERNREGWCAEVAQKLGRALSEARAKGGTTEHGGRCGLARANARRRDGRTREDSALSRTNTQVTGASERPHGRSAHQHATHGHMRRHTHGIQTWAHAREGRRNQDTRRSPRRDAKAPKRAGRHTRRAEGGETHAPAPKPSTRGGERWRGTEGQESVR